MPGFRPGYALALYLHRTGGVSAIMKTASSSSSGWVVHSKAIGSRRPERGKRRMGGSAGLSLVGLILLSVACAGGAASAQTGPMISEFMAVNTRTLADEDRDFSDWIEIWNAGEQAISLGGWHLTDDARDLTKWTFPAGVVIEPNGFLIVFASGKDRRDPLHPLHTNFKLGGDGEYLALLAADGVTVMHEYSPQYPQQISDVSYGLMRHTAVMVPEGATASYRVPSVADAAADWTSPTFNDTGWDKARTGLGFGVGGKHRVSYNDCVYTAGQAQASHVTTYGIGSGFAGQSTGPLLDQATGEPTGQQWLSPRAEV